MADEPKWIGTSSVTPDQTKALGHALNCAMRPIHCGHSLCCDMEETFRSSTPFWCRFAEL